MLLPVQKILLEYGDYVKYRHSYWDFFGTWIFDKLNIQGMMFLGIIFYLLMLFIAIIFFRIKIRPIAEIPKNKWELHLHYSHLLLAIGALTMMTYLTYQFWETVMSPHMVSLGMTIEQYGYLWTINGIVIIVFQNWVTKVTSNWSLRKSVSIGTMIFAITFPPLIWADKFWEMVIITIVLVIGEMLFHRERQLGFPKSFRSSFKGREWHL